MSLLFTGQHPQENVLVVTRPHWLRLAGKIVTAVLLFFPLPVLYGVLAAFLPQALEEPYRSIVLLGFALYGYFVWVFFFLGWLNYWLDLWIVTDERVLKVEQHGLFRREFNEFRLSRVQDVTVEIKGLVPTLFKFGNLVVQTAGENPGFMFKAIPHPEKVKDIILYHQDTSLKKMHAASQNPPPPPTASPSGGV